MNSTKIRVSFMFLGGLPDLKSDAGRAWKNWILYARNHHSQYLNKIMFVAHPMHADYKLSPAWKKIFGSSMQFYALTQKNEHLQTAWATRSLVDATILMIRKSFKLSKYVQKFILLDGTNCPLYNLKVIYDTVTSNRLNWLDSPLQNKCQDLRNRQAHKDLTAPSLECPFYNGSSHCFQAKDCSYWSQWCILDVRYFTHLLVANIVKDETLISCPLSGSQVNQIVVKKDRKKPLSLSDQTVNATLSAFVDPLHHKPCVIADEQYFGMFLKKNRNITEFLNTVFVIKLSDLKTKYSEIKKMNVSVTLINKSDIRHSSGSSLGYQIDGVDVASIHHYKREAFLDKYHFFINPIKINDRLVRGRYTVPSTYTDWRYSNPDPMNVFRSFQYKEFKIDDLIEKNPSELITLVKSWNARNQTVQSLKMNVISRWFHPMQYNTRSVKVFVNAYNLTEYFSKMGNDHELRELRDEYKTILTKYIQKDVNFQNVSIQENFFIIFRVEQNFEFAQLIDNNSSKQKKIGCPVTHDVLNQARQRGSLFVRKCEHGSYIQKYSNQLFDTKSYLYKNLLKQ